jgi:DNA mismatch endonuclease, patch repair protein
MLGNRSRDTKPEMALRRSLHAQGLRYRVDAAPLKGLRRRADVLFTRAKVAVYVDGCFWHGCHEHYKPPGTNALYWAAKVERNRVRDQDTDSRLEAEGWDVVRVWEHEPVEQAAKRVREAVQARARG